jgi:hypothetical protein
MGFGQVEDEDDDLDGSEGEPGLNGWSGQGTPGPGAYDAPSSFM